MFNFKKILILTSLISLTSCWISSTWSKEKREEFKIECESQIYFETGGICFNGFKFDEIDTVTVIEKENTFIIDTLFIYPQQKRNKFDEERQRFSGTPEIKFNVNHTYEFFLESDTPYILDNMEMIMWSQYTMAGEGWGCEMGNFTIDNKKFEHEGGISFRKRGFKYDWE